VDFLIKGRGGTLTGINCNLYRQKKQGEIDALLSFKEHVGGESFRFDLVTKNLEKEENDIRYVSLWEWVLEPND
jgi:uncharacterized protein